MIARRVPASVVKIRGGVAATAAVLAFSLLGCENPIGRGRVCTCGGILRSEVRPDSVDLPPGAQVNLDATLITNMHGEGCCPDTLEADGVFEWTSSDESIATVDGEGVVSAVKPGSATIFATGRLGEVSETAGADVTVSEPASSGDGGRD